MEEIEVHELEPNVEYIKIHGLQRTGTNYLSHLVNENLDARVLVNLGGWKHGHYHAPWFLGREVHVLVLAKHPYSWLVSMYKYWSIKRDLRIGMDLQGITFDQFVRNKAVFELQRDIPYLFRASNPVQFWNNMYFHWMTIRLNAKKVGFVKYEELLQDAESVIDNLSKTFSVLKKDKFVNSDTTFTPSGESIAPDENKFSSRDYYLENKFFEYYTPELLDFVNQQLDLEVLDHYNYWLLSPQDL